MSSLLKTLLFSSLFLFTDHLVQVAFAQTNVEYYRHLVFRESPVSQHRGIYPISPTEAKHTAHYRFTFNTDAKVVEISHRIGDQLIADNGNWDSFTWWSPKITIKYTNNEEIVRFYDHFDEPTLAFGGPAKAIYHLDESGRRAALFFYDLENNETENHWNVHRYEWEYPKKGVTRERRFNLENKPAFLRPVLTFNEVDLSFGDDDLLDFMYHIDENGNLLNNSMKAAVDRIVYDHDGNFIRWMVFDKDTNLVEGNRPQLALGEHLYDNYGNKVGLRGYDVHMHPKAMPNGIALTKRKYDSFGNLIEEKFYDVDGNQVHRQISVFSDDGTRRVGVEFWDKDGNLRDHPNLGYAKLVFNYDSNGRQSDRSFFSANGDNVTAEVQQ